MALRIRTDRRTNSAPRVSHSTSSSVSSTSTDAGTPTATIQDAVRVQRGPAPRRVAIVGTGREALALSPNSAEQFGQGLNLSMAVCSSPEINLQFPPPGTRVKPNPNPGPVLRRIASEALGLSTRASGSSSRPLPSLQTTPQAVPKGLPPPPRPHRRRPPPVFVTTLGAPLVRAEQAYSPFAAPKTPRASSVPPSAVSSSFWGSAGQAGTTRSLRSARSYASHVGSTSSGGSDSEEVDLDGLGASYDDLEESRCPLGGTYFPPAVDSRRARAAAAGGVGRRPLRVQVSVEQVAFRDNSPRQRQFAARWESEDEDGARVGLGAACAGWEDGIKTRRGGEEPQGQPTRAKVSLGKALGRWLRKHT